MAIIDNFRDDVTGAIHAFTKRYSSQESISNARKKEMLDMQALLMKSDDPLSVRQDLEIYLARMSNGFLSLFVFLDVNRLRNAVNAVVGLDKYQELPMLKALLAEKNALLLKLGCNNDQDISYRLQELEKKYAIQEDRTSKLAEEINLLRCENGFLYQTISNLNVQIQKVMQEKLDLLKRAEIAEKKLALLEQQDYKGDQALSEHPASQIGL